MPDYSIVSEHIPSRVVLFAKNKFKKNGVWHTWIDFPRFHELAMSGKDFSTEDYLIKTPQTGLSGRKTSDWYLQKTKMKNKKQLVDEKTDELKFYA